MHKRYALGTLFGLHYSFTPAAVVWHAGLALVCALLAALLLRLSLVPAVLAGLLSALLFFVSEWLHQLGHALAARLVGYPMRGVHFFSLFGASVYPAEEPELPRRVHVLRSLGGFWVNVVLGALLLPGARVALAVWPNGGVWAWLTLFGAVVNLAVLGFGALLPLRVPGGDGLTDGGALLRWWREARAERRV